MGQKVELKSLWAVRYHNFFDGSQCGYMFTVSVLLRWQFFCRYLWWYLQIRLIAIRGDLHLLISATAGPSQTLLFSLLKSQLFSQPFYFFIYLIFCCDWACFKNTKRHLLLEWFHNLNLCAFKWSLTRQLPSSRYLELGKENRRRNSAVGVWPSR